MPPSATPKTWMRQAIALSRRGFPAPNPHVGCVLVRDGECVGEGFHAFAGGPHAEVAALNQAGPRAKGATAYVTLEPCNHHGRTGPCSEALIQAGVAKVVVAVLDPNPRASGGLDRLRGHGIVVEADMLAEEAAEANRRWLESMRMKRPFIALKAAVSLDGRIALPSGESKWITGEAARTKGRRLRAELGAVLVGSGTVLADDPQLTARIRGAKNPPVRIVLDGRGRLSGNERLFRQEGKTLWFVENPTRPEQRRLPDTPHGFDLHALMAELWAEGITGLLIEGGAATHASFVRARLADELHLFTAPKALGAGPSWLEDIGLSALAEAAEWTLLHARRVGNDLHTVYRRF